MKLIDIKNYFLQELNHIYTQAEIIELFFIFSEKILSVNKLEVRMYLEKNILSKDIDTFFDKISQLKTGKPYQYVLGEAYLFGNKFFVDENVLIPRPETEELIDIISKKIPQSINGKIKILDIGTGSGCIAISLAKIFVQAEITGIDISKNALELANRNAEYNNVKINFLQKDYLKEEINDSYDIIVSNPPYICFSEENEIPFSVKKFEPNIALFAPVGNSLAFYEKIAIDLEKNLKNDGWVFLEINQKLGKETLELFDKKLNNVEILKDMSNNDRFIVGSNKIKLS